MSRSLKKGPFVETSLLEKIEGMNRGGDKKVVGFLIGQIMKATRGNADGGRARELLMEKLDS